MDDREPPNSAALTAFGVAGLPLERLVGGRGRTWRAGDIVLRPHDGAEETDWRADVLMTLEHTSAFRCPRPVATGSGSWRSGPWEAWEWLPGHADESRVTDVIAAGTAFHRAIAHLGRPVFLDRSDDAWSRADRMAWNEEPLPHDPSLGRLAAAFRPVESPAQLVHGDLLGNVLFADGAPPTVIDWPAYWRPVGLGAAIAAVDAVCWHGFPTSGLDALGDGIAEWSQLLVRAMTFRIATLYLLGAWDDAGVRLHDPVIDVVTRAVDRTADR
jgi:uncharacterized protein (TIGR02569 family)